MYTQPLYEPQFYDQTQQHLEFVYLLIASNYPEEWFFFKDEYDEMDYDILLNDFTITPISQRSELYGQLHLLLPEDREHPVYKVHAEYHSHPDSGYSVDPETGRASVTHVYKKSLPLNVSRLYSRSQCSEDDIAKPFYICNIPLSSAPNPYSETFTQVLEKNFPEVFGTGDQTILVPHPNAIPTYWIGYNGNFARLRTVDECTCRTEEMDVWFNLQSDINWGMPYVNNNDVISIMTPWHFEPTSEYNQFMVNREHFNTMIPLFNKPNAVIFTTGFRQCISGGAPDYIDDPKTKRKPNGVVYYSPDYLCPLNQYWQAISNWNGEYGIYRLWRYIDENFGTYPGENRVTVEKAPYEGSVPNPDQIITGLSEYVYQTQDFSPSVPVDRYTAPPMRISEPLPVLVATMDAYWSWKIHYVLPLNEKPRLKNHSEWHRAYDLPYTMHADLVPYVDLVGEFDDENKTATFIIPDGAATTSDAEWKRITLLMARELTSNQDFVPSYSVDHQTDNGNFESVYTMYVTKDSAPNASVFDDHISGSIKLKFIHSVA